MKLNAAILAGLLLPPLAPLMLGHSLPAVASLAVEVVIHGLILTGALATLPWLLALGMGAALLNRLAAVIFAVKLPPKSDSGGPLFVVIAGAAMLGSLGLPIFYRSFLVEAFKIPSGSMIPTLEIGDHLFVDKRARTPARGDVVVYRYPKEPTKDFIKRVLAVGGDTVEWQGQVPVINGKPVARRAVAGECSYRDYDEVLRRWESRHCVAFDEELDGRNWRIIQDSEFERPNPGIRVPAGSYYMIGDNRDNSHDSRFYGAVPAKNIKGTALGVWFSSGQEVRWERVGLKVK